MGTLGLKRNAKIALSLIYFALVLLVRGALRLAGRLPSQRLTILYYHGVPATRRRGFVRQMDALKRAACVLPAAYRGELPSKRKCVALTFDDGLHSVIENALPELAARSFHSTIFVPVGLIGRRPDWRMEEGASELAEVVMTVEQLRALDGERVAIGSHTISHPSMSGLDRHGARKEIEDSRHQLAAASGREVRLFSFPYGDHDACAIAMCRAAGYDCVFSILAQGIDTTGSEFVRGRTKVDPSDGPLEFYLKFNGGYEWKAYTAGLGQKLRSMLGQGKLRLKQ